MGANNFSARSVYNSRSVWLPAVVIVIFLLSFVHLNVRSHILSLSNVAKVTQTSAFEGKNVSPEPPAPVEVQEDDGFVSELKKDPLRIYVPPAEIPSDNPLNDVWHPNHKDQPVEIATPEDPEAYHKGPTEAEVSPKECPPTPFDISKCPSVQQMADNIKSATPSVKLADDRPLVTYAYAESDFGRVNLKFFVMHALHDAADFIFILNGETDVAETILPIGRPNVQIIKRDNTCFDLGAHAEVLSKEENGARALKDRYKRFILMNASIRGPFVPHWSKECWTEAYLGRLNEKVKVRLFLASRIDRKLISIVGGVFAQLHGWF